MKVTELLLEVAIKLKDVEHWKEQIRKYWGNSVVIRQITKQSTDGRDLWVAKKPSDWKEYPNDASMKVGSFALVNGKRQTFMCVVYTPAEVDKLDREAATIRQQVKKQRAEDRKKATKLKTDFFKGQRVKLVADEEEGWNEETGEVASVRKLDRMLIVLIDKKFRDGAEDDGFREVDFNQVVPLTKKPGK